MRLCLPNDVFIHGPVNSCTFLAPVTVSRATFYKLRGARQWPMRSQRAALLRSSASPVPMQAFTFFVHRHICTFPAPQHRWEQHWRPRQQGGGGSTAKLLSHRSQVCIASPCPLFLVHRPMTFCTFAALGSLADNSLCGNWTYSVEAINKLSEAIKASTTLTSLKRVGNLEPSDNLLFTPR